MSVLLLQAGIIGIFLGAGLSAISLAAFVIGAALS